MTENSELKSELGLLKKNESNRLEKPIEKVSDFPSTVNQFRQKFASLFLKEEYQEAHLLAVNFYLASANQLHLLEEAKNAFEQLGDSENSLKIINDMLKLSPDSSSLIKEKEEIENKMADNSATNHLIEEFQSPEAKFPLPTDQDIADFINLFQGRENVYARQWSNSNGKSGYSPVTEPLSFRAVKNHLLGNYTVGLYQLDIENCVKWLAIDVDVKKEFIEYLVDHNFKKDVFQSIMNMFISVEKILSEFDIPIYLEESGFKGFHFWIFLDEKISAKIAKEFLQLLVCQLDFIPNEVKIEIFPKQTQTNNLGNLIKLPLGLHQVTGQRSFFYNRRLNPVKDFSVLSTIKAVNSTNFLRALYSWKKKNELEPKLEKMKDIENEAVKVIPPVVNKESFHLLDNEEYNFLIDKCGILAKLVDKVENTGELTNNERLAITFTFGNLKLGNLIVNELLNKIPNIDKSHLLKKPLNANPTSCQKLRNKIAHLVEPEKCDCKFENLMNSYAHPLLHLKELDKSRNPETIDELQLKKMVESYIALKKEWNEIQRKMRLKEDQLNEYLTRAGVEEIVTSFGTFTKNPETKTFILKL